MYKDGFYFEERFLRSSSANRHCKVCFNLFSGLASKRPEEFVSPGYVRVLRVVALSRSAMAPSMFPSLSRNFPRLYTVLNSAGRKRTARFRHSSASWYWFSLKRVTPFRTQASVYSG